MAPGLYEDAMELINREPLMESNIRQGYSLIEHAALDGHVRSMLLWGLALKNADYFQTYDLERGTEFIIRAADAGDPCAIALCHRDGFGTYKKDIALHFSFLQPFILLSNDPVGSFYLGAYYGFHAYSGRDFSLPTAAVHYERAVRQKYAPALCNLGMLYDSGHGVRYDPAATSRLWTTAVSLGSANAMCLQGNSQSNMHLLEQAAAQNYPMAVYGLGLAHARGRLCKTDLVKAAELFERAACLGEWFAMEAIATCYEGGKGVPRDGVKAFKWFRAGASAGDSNCTSRVGSIYMGSLPLFRSIVAFDAERALYYYRKGNLPATSQPKVLASYPIQ